jgi:hypothetical protein
MISCLPCSRVRAKINARQKEWYEMGPGQVLIIYMDQRNTEKSMVGR